MATLPVVNSKDKNAGIVVSVIAIALLLLYLLLYHFQLADPPPTNPPLKAEVDFKEIVLEELKIEAGGAGGGEPSDDQVAPPTPQVTNVITDKNPNVKVTTGKSNKTNTKQPTDNTATTTQQSNDPFNKGGSQGGAGGGDGGVFGKDSGKEGQGGEGTGSGEGRVRYNEINVDEIYTTSVITVRLKLSVNAEGQVVSAQSVSSGTTTTDQRIINQVIAAAKSQLRFNKKAGAVLETQWYTVKIVPN